MAYSVVDVYGSFGSGKDNLFDEIEDDIDTNDFKMINLAEPVDLGNAATKQYVDTRFPSSSSWNLEGNTATAVQRLGTKNDVDFAIIRNNETTGGILPEGILMYKETRHEFTKNY